MNKNELLETITDLSHRYGGDEFVKAGGGNTSVKNDQYLWVKPSGTTLAGITTDGFVQIERAAIEELYNRETPKESNAREALVKEIMGAAVVGDDGKRPSVEAPLHNVFSATYVVHTHPVLVNGLTCGQIGKKECARLFPDALWVDYIDPGYTLCMEVRKAINEYRDEMGIEPDLLFMKNHGIFVAAKTSDGIIELYDQVIETLAKHYAKNGVKLELTVSDIAPQTLTDDEVSILKSVCGEELVITPSPRFELPSDALSPDHIVYMKSSPYVGAINKSQLEVFVEKNGYTPRIIITDGGLYAVGTDQASSERALLLAQDEARISQLAEAFGGFETLSAESIHFIDTWEVEQYRRQMANA